MPHRQRVVILGGGFGGLNAAKTLAREPFDITLADRRNFHLFQPLLYQVATGGLSPANIASPLRAILKSFRNVEVLMANVTGIDVPGRRVLLEGGELPYDVLVVATGSSHHYFGHPEWEAFAPSLKTIEDATEIRRRVLLAFEEAERAENEADRKAWLNFVVVGGGPTGVELAGAVAELARHTLKHNFRRIDPARATIQLIEGVDRVLPTYAEGLSQKAAESLAAIGVTLRTGARVTDIQSDRVLVQIEGREEPIPTHTVLWAAGVAASPLGRMLADGAGVQLDRVGRVVVEPDLSLAGHPEIFVLGDLANFSHPSGTPLPGLAPVAIQQGRYVAQVLRRRRLGKTLGPFQYHDRGQMATIGRARAVADLHGHHLSGFFAWAMWLMVHLMYLVGYRNRVLVLMQWAWNYTTRNSSARLITSGKSSLGPAVDYRRDKLREDGHHDKSPVQGVK